MNMEDLPVELASRILLKVPAGNLTRCKFVCKRWRSLIESPWFIDQHIKENNAGPDCVLVKYKDAATKSYVVALINREAVEVVDTQIHLSDTHGQDVSQSQMFVKKSEVLGCCNGVVCLWFAPMNTIVLWNPTTRDSKHVPRQSCFTRVEVPPLVLAVGFGFDARNNDYKLVSVQQILNYKVADDNRKSYQPVPPFQFEAEVYSLKEDSWRLLTNVETEDLFHVRRSYSDRVCVGGMFSWLDGDRDAIVSFNMSDEVFITTPLPDSIRSDGLIRNNLVVHVNINGSLAVANESRFGNDQNDYYCYGIWVLGEYGVKESWTMLFGNIGPLRLFRQTIMGFWNNPDCLLIKETCPDSSIEQCLSLLDPATNTRKNIANFRALSIVRGMYNFKPSLVPINTTSPKLCS